MLTRLRFAFIKPDECFCRYRRLDTFARVDFDFPLITRAALGFLFGCYDPGAKVKINNLNISATYDVYTGDARVTNVTGKYDDDLHVDGHRVI